MAFKEMTKSFKVITDENALHQPKLVLFSQFVSQPLKKNHLSLFRIRSAINNSLLSVLI